MIVLGIDPGYALMGWGVVESEGSRMKLINYGCVETKAGVPMQTRLRTLQLGVRDLLRIYRPDDVAFEELFFARNVTTALMVGAARGAAIIAACAMLQNAAECSCAHRKNTVCRSFCAAIGRLFRCNNFCRHFAWLQNNNVDSRHHRLARSRCGSYL